jgi:hypothetical protein
LFQKRLQCGGFFRTQWGGLLRSEDAQPYQDVLQGWPQL